MRHGVSEIEIKDDLNFLGHGPQRQTDIPENIDYHLFKCLGGNVINKTRRQRFIHTCSYRETE